MQRDRKMSKWHCAINDKKYGPVSADQLRQWISEGRLSPTDYVWTDGMADWVPYNTVEELSHDPTPHIHPQNTDQFRPQQGNGLAVAGMVLGIVSLALICLWPIALICAVVGICLSFAGKSRAEETNTGAGMAVAGIVLSCVTIALVVIGAIVGLTMMNSIFHNMPRHR
jgi:hypothetical protein